MTKDEKDKAVDKLRDEFNETCHQLEKIEHRLQMYFYEMIMHPQYHNSNEIKGAVKFFRLFQTYIVDEETFKDVIYKYEGIWEQRDGVWHHIEGGLKHPGTTGPQYYR